MLEGEAEIAGTLLARRDSIAFSGDERVEIAARSASDLLLVETAI